MLRKNQVDQISHPIADRVLLEKAWQSVRAAGGGPGIDRQTLEQFAERLQREIASRNGYDLVDHSLVLYVRPKPDGGSA